MNKIFLFSVLCLLFSCSDGDIQIETIDFDNVAAQHCGTLAISTELFFKINDNEALILTLQAGVLKNEVTTEDIVSTVPSQSKLTYRIFSDKVTKNYFCDSPPPATPTVIEEIEATAGSITIQTVAVTNGDFIHTIQLNNITFLKEDGTRITNLLIQDFAVLTTKP